MTNSGQRRLTHWRLRLLRTAQDADHVAWTCRHFGISRKTFYQWRQRHQRPRDVGLADRALAPHHSPRATPPTGVVRRRQRLGGVLSYYYWPAA
jgi:transposase-like protein